MFLPSSRTTSTFPAGRDGMLADLPWCANSRNRREKNCRTRRSGMDGWDQRATLRTGRRWRRACTKIHPEIRFHEMPFCLTYHLPQNAPKKREARAPKRCTNRGRCTKHTGDVVRVQNQSDSETRRSASQSCEVRSKLHKV